MAIVCVKIGENEPDTYGKFSRLAMHLDVVEVLPRKRDAQGKILLRTIGVKGDKHFFGLNVDMDILTDAEFKTIRQLLTSRHSEMKYKYTIDISPAYYVHLGISSSTVAAIDVCRDKRRAKQDYDMMSINRYDKKVSFKDFARTVRNKATGQYLYDELDLEHKALPQALVTVTFNG